MPRPRHFNKMSDDRSDVGIVGAKSLFSHRRKVSNSNLPYLGRFQHLTQHGQGFFEVQYQVETTSGLSAVGPQSCNIFAVLFFGEKIPLSRHRYI